MESRKKIISYGGGVDSTAMIIEMGNRGMLNRNIRIVMFDTGAEDPRTLQFVRDHMIPRYDWIEIVTPLYGGLGLYDYCLEHKTIPSFTGGRFCTVEYKIKPFIKLAGEYNQSHAYVALSADETGRVERFKGYADVDCTVSFPLYEWGIGREQCKQIIAASGLPVPPKSSCFFCPFKSALEWRSMPFIQPDLFVKSVLLENAVFKRSVERGKKLFPIKDADRPLTHFVGLDESLKAAASNKDVDEIMFNYNVKPYVPYKRKVKRYEDLPD